MSNVKMFNLQDLYLVVNKRTRKSQRYLIVYKDDYSNYVRNGINYFYTIDGVSIKYTENDVFGFVKHPFYSCYQFNERARLGSYLSDLSKYDSSSCPISAIARKYKSRKMLSQKEIQFIEDALNLYYKHSNELMNPLDRAHARTRRKAFRFVMHKY